MGVKNLWDILESCKKTLPLHHLRNKRVCVDLSCWMVQLQSVNRFNCAMKEKLYLRDLFHRLRVLIALNCSLIFVTVIDITLLSRCSTHATKESAYRCQLSAGIEAIQNAKNLDNASSLKKIMGSEFSCMIKEAKSLGVALGIQCLDGIEEAEAQCALLNSESLCDGCFTSASDAFLFGARTVYRDICLGEGGYVICYEMDDIERKLGFGRGSMIALDILLGSDHNQGIDGFGPESACQIVRSMGDSSVLQQIAAVGFSFAKKPKNLIKEGKNFTDENKDKRDLIGSESDMPTENQCLQVINAYMKPKCHSANSDVVYRVLALHPVNRGQLHHVCAQYFDWPPTKTDEYILPVIAERNLRRFANLCSTSSELGVCLPITKMAVKCPVSRIVDQIKIQGGDYFEVSWEDIDGLQVSVVPADLVESACPQKILEFHQSRQSREKTEDTTAELKEIETKLRLLVNNFEQESSSLVDTVSLGGTDEHISRQKNEGKLEKERSSSSNVISCVDIEQQRMKRLNSKLGSGDGESAGSCCSTAASRAPEIVDLSTPAASRAPEIVDLLTPAASSAPKIVDLITPPPKFQAAGSVDVIELCDTPQHARGMRFIDVIEL